MAAAVFTQWEKLQAVDWSIRADLLVYSLTGAVVLFFLDAYGWHLILRALGASVPANRTVRVWLVSSLARYVPGAVWAYASRISLAKAEGISTTTVSLSLYIETVLLALSALAVGSAALLANVALPGNQVAVLVVCVLLGVTLHPRVLGLLRYVPGAIGKAMKGARLPSAYRMIGLYAYYVTFWALFGVVFLGFVHAVHPVAAGDWLPVSAAMALSFFVGFAVMIAPGGIGVRESALYFLLLPFMPSAASLVVSIGSRLWIMAAEAISLAVVLLLGRETPARVKSESRKRRSG